MSNVYRLIEYMRVSGDIVQIRFFVNRSFKGDPQHLLHLLHTVNYQQVPNDFYKVWETHQNDRVWSSDAADRGQAEKT